MGMLARLHEARSSWTGPYSLRDPALKKLYADGGIFGHTPTIAGVPVSNAMALMYSAVFAAVNVLSSDIAKAPLNLRKTRQNGGSDLYLDSPVYQLLKHEPNSEMGAMNFRQALTAHALTLGGGYAEIERNGMGRPMALWPITPDRIKPVRDERTGRLYYLVDNRDELDAADVLHIHGLGYDGTCGYALLDLARQAVGLGLAAERFNAAFFGNNSTFGGVIGFDQRKEPEELVEYGKRINETSKGAERAFKLLLLDDGAKYTPFGMTNTDAQLDELRDKQVEEVSRYYRMPLHKLNNLKRATFSNVEQQDLEYYKGPVLDWMTLWEQECNRKLIAKVERRIQFFKHNANVFLRGDITSRYTALGIARDKGVINANEWRDLEDMNPQDGEQGTQYLVQSAQIPADRIGTYTDAQIDKLEADAQPAPAPVAAPVDPAATERADRAEAFAAELREQLAALQRTADMQTDEVRAEAARLRAQIEAADQVVDVTRAAVVRVEAERDAARLAQSAETTAREAAELAATEARNAAEVAEARVVAALADVSAATEASTEATLAAVAAAELARAATTDKAIAEAAAAEARAMADAAMVRAVEAERSAGQAQASTVEARGHAERQAAEEATRRVAEAVADITRKASERSAADAARQDRLVQRMHEERLRIMRGALDRECDRARRAQQTPAKLRQWIETWYDGHGETLAASLLPSVRTHLAFIGSDEDAGALTRALVAEHVASSRKQIAGVADLDGDALAAELAGLLRRWETERAQTIPDALMEKELAYVRKQ
jgi:HK97 family phage portal protein